MARVSAFGEKTGTTFSVVPVKNDFVVPAYSVAILSGTTKLSYAGTTCFVVPQKKHTPKSLDFTEVDGGTTNTT